MSTTGDGDPWGITTLDLFELLEDAVHSDQSWAVATVIAVDGSAYRRPGAKMLFGPDDSAFGGITAGLSLGPPRRCRQRGPSGGRAGDCDVRPDVRR